jgi:hypothetical protein
MITGAVQATVDAAPSRFNMERREIFEWAGRGVVMGASFRTRTGPTEAPALAFGKRYPT